MTVLIETCRQPSGATCLVYCNGTNFYSGLSGAAGDFTVGGTATANNIVSTGNVTATTFTGSLSGAASSATTAGTAVTAGSANVANIANVANVAYNVDGGNVTGSWLTADGQELYNAINEHFEEK